MKIISTQQIRDLDEYTIKNEPIASINLMERAATIFFKWQMPKLAFLDMILIMIVTFYTYKQFLPISKTAGYLLIPYMLWLCVAFSLNLYIILNN
jgi:tryptophan-rich sensory protein